MEYYEKKFGGDLPLPCLANIVPGPVIAIYNDVSGGETCYNERSRNTNEVHPKWTAEIPPILHIGPYCGPKRIIQD